MKRWSVARSDSVFLCDDDNDMELAAEVGRAFLPSISSVRSSDSWVGVRRVTWGGRQTCGGRILMSVAVA